MSQHWIYINSPGYRRFVEATKQRKWLLYGTTVVLGGIGSFMAWGVSSMTNPSYEEEGYKNKDEELAKLPLHSQLVARKNKEFLREMMVDVQNGTDKARYQELLSGRIHNTPHGTTMPEPPK